jgi:type IV secretion system protein VirB4
MHLFKRGPQDLIPATNYIAHIIEEGLDGRPTAIFMEEAWAALLHEDMGRTVEEWLRTIRDKNGIMVFASQSLRERERSSLHAILATQIPTKVFAPDANAEAEVSKALYRRAGLRPTSEALTLLPRGDYLMVRGGWYGSSPPSLGAARSPLSVKEA